MSQRITDIGEFGLIKHLSRLLHPGRIPVELGDDTAAIPMEAGYWLLATTDTLVEGVHFRRDWARPWEIGYKSMAVNISDIASMGGLPTYALISLSLPGSLETDWVEQLYLGLEACAGQWGVAIVGGDTVSGPQISLTVTLLGKVEAGRALTRGGGRVGDLLLVTSDLGGSSAGLDELISPSPQYSASVREKVLQKHLLPVPRLCEGRLLVSSAGAGALTDLSDGLAQGIKEICSASKTGAEIYIDSLPIASYTRKVAAAHGKQAFEYALFGGEDYELLFSVHPSQAPALKAALKSSCGTVASVIGCLLPSQEAISLVGKTGRFPLEKGGHDHFMAVLSHG